MLSDFIGFSSEKTLRCGLYLDKETDMKKTLIVFACRAGFTERYAQWISEELGAVCIPLKEFRTGMEDEFSLIICGGGICGSSINGIRQFRRIEKRNPQKQIIYFAVGLRPISDDTVRLLKKYNFGNDSHSAFYYFQGGLDLEKLQPMQKGLLICFKSMLKRRPRISPQDRELLRLMQISGDYSDRMQTSSLISFSRGIQFTLL